nr:MAG TPA: hypothetical protein [Caudoviricetes sp.]
MTANFTPTLEDYTNQKPFRFWCQKVLPLVYDDSISYYELLNKVVHYLNNVIKDVSAMGGNINDLLDAFIKLQNYVNYYFDNLDIQSEVNNIIDRMIKDGTFSALFGTADTVDMMQNTLYSVGRFVTTEGYYYKGDGGNNTYITTAESVNDLSIKSKKVDNLYFTAVEIFNAKKFDGTGSNIQTNDRGSASINILRYGCKKYPTENGEYPESTEISNEYDCSSILNSLLSYGLSLFIPNGTFICTHSLYALEINLELSNNARLLYDGEETQYFIAVNTATSGTKTFITYRSRISGGIIDTHYKARYAVCANRCVGLIFDNVIIQNFLREGIYLGSISAEIPEYVIETRVVNSTIRNFRRGSFTKEGSTKAYPYPWGAYGIYSGGTDNFFSNVIIQNTQRGVYTGSDDKFTNVHIWQSLGALYDTSIEDDYSDYFKETIGFVLPPNAVCSFANCTIDNMRTAYYLQAFANVSEFGTMFLFSPQVIDAIVLNDKVGGLRYVAFANDSSGNENMDFVYSAQFHSFGAQFTLPIKQLVSGNVNPLIRLVPDSVVNQLNGVNFRIYTKRWNFEGYYPTVNMTNQVEYGYNANRTLLNFDGSTSNVIKETTDLDALTKIGAFSAVSRLLTNYPTDFPSGDVVILNVGTDNRVAQVIYHQTYSAYRFIYNNNGVITRTPWRKVYQLPVVKIGKYRVACPTEINVYSKADPTSAIRNTIPNGTVFTITSYTTAFDTNWGFYVNESNLNCFVDLSFCKFVE